MEEATGFWMHTGGCIGLVGVDVMLPMAHDGKPLQSRVHIVVVREIRAKIGIGQRCVESMVEYDQRKSIV